MTAVQARSTPRLQPPEPDLLRFDRTERLVHWTTAMLFLTVLFTGASLYAGPVSQLVGRRDLVRSVHVIAGLCLPLPFLRGVVGRWGRRLRSDVERLNRWSIDDRRWWRRAKRSDAQLGKFNPGQKLNATFIAAAVVVRIASGSMMKWFEPFPDSWRTGATFVHDWFALGLWLAIGGHVWFALRDADALRAMLHGTIPARWARAHRPRWYEEETGNPANRLKNP